jgi:hypothetical protein
MPIDQCQLCIWFYGSNYRPTTMSPYIIQCNLIRATDDSNGKSGRYLLYI